MRPDFEKLMKEHNVHGMILNNNGIINALEKSYELGKLESEEKYNKLKNTFLDLLKELNNTQIQEDWKKEGGLI
jgi:hypothetical protein